MKKLGLSQETSVKLTSISLNDTGAVKSQASSARPLGAHDTPGASAEPSETVFDSRDCLAKTSLSGDTNVLSPDAQRREGLYKHEERNMGSSIGSEATQPPWFAIQFCTHQRFAQRSQALPPFR
jgi:hypothetical protein